MAAPDTCSTCGGSLAAGRCLRCENQSGYYQFVDREIVMLLVLRKCCREKNQIQSFGSQRERVDAAQRATLALERRWGSVCILSGQ